MSNMTRVESSVEIDAPVTDVFAYASDWRHWEEWWQGVRNFKPISEVTRANGTRYAYNAWMAGLAINIETEVHGFVENGGWEGVLVGMNLSERNDQKNPC